MRQKIERWENGNRLENRLNDKFHRRWHSMEFFTTCDYMYTILFVARFAAEYGAGTRTTRRKISHFIQARRTACLIVTIGNRNE